MICWSDRFGKSRVPPSMKVAANGIQIWYDSFGQPAHPPLLLLMGAGVQSLYWPDPLCRMLADGGRYVVRFDHRDLGASSWLDSGAESWSELENNPPYSLADLAADAIGLLEGLGLSSAHFVGAWLGGVVTEVAAGLASKRLLSATLIGATPPLHRDQFAKLWPTMEHNHRPLESPEPLVEQGLSIARQSAGPGFPFEEPRLRALWQAMVERGNRRMARARHVSTGFFSSRPGPSALADSHLPVLILEGTAELGYAAMAEYASQVPEARFVPIEGLGHELPQPVWPLIAREVLEHTSLHA